MDEYKYKNLMILLQDIFTVTQKILSLYYDELIEKIEEHKAKKYLMVQNYILDKVLDKIKEIIGTLSTNIFKRSIINRKNC